MFCFQCQETMKNSGCKVGMGVCGKKDVTSDLQDLLIFTAKGVARTHSKLRTLGKTHDEAYDYLLNSLFITITNANFDDEMIIEEIKRGTKIRDEIKAMVGANCDSEISSWQVGTLEEMLELASRVGVLRTENEDIRSLRELVLYGLKGMAAYTHHAMHIGMKDEDIVIFLERALKSIDDDEMTGEELTALVLETGEYGVKAMDLLDRANRAKLGNPEATTVSIAAGKRPGILVTGHDLNDMRQLLEQTVDSGIDIYTHSEMLPAHGYPELKKYPHLVGNYGAAWHAQRDDFENFNGPVIFTTNCIVPPRKDATYNDRIFTANATGYPGWKKVKLNSDGSKDFSDVIAMAKTCEAPKDVEQGSVMTGFAHNQVFAVADKVVEAVKSGAIKKFIVMAGCDGRMNDRSYYTEFAKALPKDTIILTAGCAKFRYNKLPLGDINGIPRVLDAGQCNDSYSLAVIAMKLRDIFELNSINDLPLAYNIAWYEQKAVIVLLALLYLGVKNIHLGPTIPAFLSPNVTDVLVKNFGLAPITTVENDMKLFGLAD